MAGFDTVLWTVGGYLIVMVIMYLGLNFLTKGFLNQYIKVKLSRGKLILVKCHDVTDSYYKSVLLIQKKPFL